VQLFHCKETQGSAAKSEEEQARARLNVSGGSEDAVISLEAEAGSSSKD
jgi:hypothetical protein